MIEFIKIVGFTVVSLYASFAFAIGLTDILAPAKETRKRKAIHPRPVPAPAHTTAPTESPMISDVIFAEIMEARKNNRMKKGNTAEFKKAIQQLKKGN